ncbi:endonuclease/exonuclease/phosphatase family protein [Luminiphilus sp. nBUS_07]|uniref:endonuclease/exonuclease/phosphatase family protein n=1 Tax=Luminiphilus sp. nBUS_07 TaxID=3395314 RepID=UPI003EBCE653
MFLGRRFFNFLLLVGLPLATLGSNAAVSDFVKVKAPSVSYGVASCQIAMARPVNQPSSLPSAFQLVTWNIEKGNDPRWLEDLTVYQSPPELMLLQEAYTPSPFEHLMGTVLHESFAKGYRAGHLQTGVLSVSSATPQLHCALTAYEPWLSTPKATSVTRYGFAKSEQTLLVVNAHMVNFEWGVTGFSDQWAQIEQVLQRHEGPLIVAGDFNTWSPRRLELLEGVKARHKLNSVSFTPDRRTTFFGSPLDHVLVRQLTATHSHVLASGKSDHNSLWVNLRLK